jgi:dihydrolipoamide dehydrogenase
MPLKISKSLLGKFSYDAVVLGGGPGGYVAAIRLAQFGLKTVCIEKESVLGGTCLNLGCIPSKTLLSSSHKFHSLTHASQEGIEVGEFKLNLNKMMQNKLNVVSSLTKGIDFLFKKNKVSRIQGYGVFKDPHTILVSNGDEISAKHFIIATGSVPNKLPIYDGVNVVTSDEAIAFNEVPKELVVIGGGIIGLELGSVWQRLGSQVTVVEHKHSICAQADPETSEYMLKYLQASGMKFKFGSRLDTVKDSNVVLQSGEMLPYSKLLLSIGRKPATSNIGLDIIGVETDKFGTIAVDDRNRTKAHSHIYVVGDAAPGPMLAHKAEDEGIYVANQIAGKKAEKLEFQYVPSVVYTHPEAAWVGKLTGDKKALFPFTANSRAKAVGETEGFVQVYSENGKLCGASVVGSRAGELIYPLTMAIKHGASALDIGEISTAHPTFSEAVREACLAVDFKPIHF